MPFVQFCKGHWAFLDRPDGVLSSFRPEGILGGPALLYDRQREWKGSGRVGYSGRGRIRSLGGGGLRTNALASDARSVERRPVGGHRTSFFRGLHIRGDWKEEKSVGGKRTTPLLPGPGPV